MPKYIFWTKTPKRGYLKGVKEEEGGQEGGFGSSHSNTWNQGQFVLISKNNYKDLVEIYKNYSPKTLDSSKCNAPFWSFWLWNDLFG